jgi:hypothetical protein
MTSVSSAARLSRSLTESASPSMARPASALAILGGNSRFTAMPTAAPTSVSAMRCHAADSALSEPTPSTSMPLIATSMRFERSRRTWPMVIETRMSRPRLHHSSGKMYANATATDTPATTATTRSRPLARRETGVTWTTSIAVSGASSGSVPGKNSVATT